MPDFYNDPAVRLDALIDRQERNIANVFRTAVAALRDEIDLDEIADLIERGRADEALDRLKFIAERIGAASTVTFITSGQSTAEWMTGAGVGRIVFNQINPFAVAAMQANQLRLIRDFTEQQRQATSFALIAGTESGINPRAQARNFRDSIGLTGTQWDHVETYRRSLESVGTAGEQTDAALGHALRDKRGDAQIKRLVREGRRIPAEKIEWLVQRKIALSIKARAEVIGRTEAMRSVNRGNEEMYRQAISDGTINAEDLERTWVTRTDGRERRTHLILNGQKRGWGEAWVTINGTLRYPGDEEAPARETIQCRCVLGTRIVRR